MAIKSLRSRPRPDNLKNQPRTSQSLARRIYLAALLVGGGWIAVQIIGPFVFLDADGMIMQDHKVVGADYTAQVLSITARPGDQVAAGQRIGMLTSTQMLDVLSDLTSRQAQAASRREQIDARLAAIKATLPAADQRKTAAEAARAAVGVHGRDDGDAGAEVPEHLAEPARLGRWRTRGEPRRFGHRVGAAHRHQVPLPGLAKVCPHKLIAVVSRVIQVASSTSRPSVPYSTSNPPGVRT